MFSPLSKLSDRSDRLLRFTPVQSDLAHRDYGMIRVTGNKIATPYPRLSAPIDPEVLQKRLDYERQSLSRVNVVGSDMVPTVHLSNVIEVKKKKMPEHMIMGTPHPQKGTALNPRTLIKRLEEHRQTNDWLDRRLQSSGSSLLKYKRNTQSRRSSITAYVSIGTPHPRKSIVLNPRYLQRRMTDMSINTIPPQDGRKKVKLMTPRPSQMSRARSTISMCSTCTRDSACDHTQSFEERRRLFHMAEYTIAKYGKKLCEIPLMPPPMRTHYEESVARNDSLSEEFQKFISEHGMKIKNPGRSSFF